MIRSNLIHSGYRKSTIFRGGDINPLAVPSVIISRNKTNPVASPKGKTLEDILQRVGICLQKILKNEYGDAYDGDLLKKRPKPQEIMQKRNPRLAHLSPTEALQSLKRGLREYANCEEPFDRMLKSDETVREWWVTLQRKVDACVLGVCLTIP